MLTAGTRSHATRQQEKAQTHRTSSYKPAPCRRSSLARLPPPVNILNIFDASDNFLQIILHVSDEKPVAFQKLKVCTPVHQFLFPLA